MALEATRVIHLFLGEDSPTVWEAAPTVGEVSPTVGEVSPTVGEDSLTVGDRLVVQSGRARGTFLEQPGEGERKHHIPHA